MGKAVAGGWGVMVLLSLVLAAGGCSSRTATVEQDPAWRQKILGEMPVMGPWSQPVGGVSCRVVLNRDRGMETGAIRGAMLLRNASDQPVIVGSSGMPPFGSEVVWRVGDLAMLGRAMAPVGEGVKPEQGKLTLKPGQLFITEPRDMLLPPGTGKRAVTAILPAEGQALMAPAMPIEVDATDWGLPVEGLRIGIGSIWSVYAVGDVPAIHLFVHNLGRDALTIHRPDWPAMKMTTQDDLITLTCPTVDSQFLTIAGGQAWSDGLLNPPLLAPGVYRIRLVMKSRELPVGNVRAWYGTIVSNDMQIEVKAK